MITCRTISDLRQHVRQWRLSGETVAFVPTMGNLHAGHLSLMKKASELTDRVVVSIFVNPLQFNDPQDYAQYPRTLDDDLECCAEHSVDLVFAPDGEEIYPHHMNVATRITVPSLDGILEGEMRPGHFQGVATIVSKLFNLVMPDVAVFGEKDFQQLQLIRRMVADLDYPIDIVSQATMREQDGLAMSSRNSRLSASARQQAPMIYQVLQSVRQAVCEKPEASREIIDKAKENLDRNGFQVEYLELRNANDLASNARLDDDAVLLIAVVIDSVRLIDNIPFKFRVT